MANSCELCKRDIPKNKGESVKRYSLKRFCSHSCANKIVSKGNKPSELNKQRVREANSGSKSPLWKGGISSDRKAYFTLKSLERYARYKGADGSFTVQEWQQLKIKHDFSCAICLKHESEVKLTKDHIKPLTKGGSNFINNIQPLCQSCNSRKSNKIDYIYNNG